MWMNMQYTMNQNSYQLNESHLYSNFFALLLTVMDDKLF